MLIKRNGVGKVEEALKRTDVFVKEGPETAYASGRRDAELIFNGDFDSAIRRLRADYGSRTKTQCRLIEFAIKDRRRLSSLSGELRLIGAVCGVLQLSALERKAYGNIYDLSYWKGVSDTLGGLRAMESGPRGRRSAPPAAA